MLHVHLSSDHSEFKPLNYNSITQNNVNSVLIQGRAESPDNSSLWGGDMDRMEMLHAPLTSHQNKQKSITHRQRLQVCPKKVNMVLIQIGTLSIK